MDEELTVPLSPKIRSALTFQRYGPKPSIASVRLHPLTKHRSLEGAFCELLRLDEAGQSHPGDAGEPFQPRQLSFSEAAPGRINAFHLHPREEQDEIWCALRGRLLVWLVDVRADSPTEGVRQRVILSGEEPALLHIPSGVAHGYRAGSEGALLFYAANQCFDRDRPNEGRLGWNHFGTELWADDHG